MDILLVSSLSFLNLFSGVAVIGMKIRHVYFP